MGFLDNVLKVFVGDKSKKDLGDIQPYVDQVKSHQAAIEKLSIDELRAKSNVFRSIIKADQKDIQDKIDALKIDADNEEDIDKKEDIYNKIDTLKDERYEVEKESLNKILGEAFAVIKETAKRFKNNETLRVTATAYDRELSALSFIFSW